MNRGTFRGDCSRSPQRGRAAQTPEEMARAARAREEAQRQGAYVSE